MKPIIFEKYCELVNAQDYDSKLTTDLKSIGESIDNFNNIITTLILKMGRVELEHLVVQLIKRDLSGNIPVGTSDDVLDELAAFHLRLEGGEEL